MPKDSLGYSDSKLIQIAHMDLKNRLSHSRQLLLGGYECCYCHKNEILEPLDLHEIIFTRGDARGNTKRELLIQHPCNCGFIHRICHPFANGPAGLKKGLDYLVRYETEEKVYFFVLDMLKYFKVLGTEKLTQIETILGELYYGCNTNT